MHYQKNPGPPITMQTWYITFPFGTRHLIGIDRLAMWNRWVEVKAETRQQAIQAAAKRFGEGFQVHSDEAFTPDRRKFYPGGCCLVITNNP